MAKKISKARLIRERTKLEWLLFILLLIVIYLLLAALKDWWPSNTNNPKLGTAFYTRTLESVEGVDGGAVGSNAGGDSDGAGGGNGGGSGGNGGNGGGGGGGSSSTSPLLSFAAGVDTGNTKEETSGQAQGLNQNCALVANSTTLGKQEVCTYTEGEKLITVTFLNDRVVSASRSGF